MSDIIFTVHNKLAIMTLNRPAALNALNRDMFLGIQEQLTQWQMDDSIKAIVIRSNVEKAFCAGGDVRAIYDLKNLPIEMSFEYFKLEYRINQLIAHYPKPIIALLNGITMGGGVGISVHASHGIASENLRWAMPETLIGFFPDVGASYYLSRMSNGVGVYLSLTGASINTADALHLRLVQSVVSYHQFDSLVNRLIETIHHSSDFDTVSRLISEFSVNTTTPASLPSEKNIADCFLFDTVEAIIQSLKTKNTPWSNETAAQLMQRAPMSLKVALEQLKRAKKMNIDEVFAMDLHLAQRMLLHGDFYEGVRAAIVDKDKKPQWHPDQLSFISNHDVESFFQ